MTCSFAKEFSSVGFTDVENDFIREYLPVSSGDAVKVYLYGLFLCKNPQIDKTAEEIAEVLQLGVDEVFTLLSYWEEFGLLSVISKEPLNITFFPVKMASGAKIRKYKPEKYTDFNKELQQVISGRMISTHEYQDFFDLMEVRGIKPDAMLLIVKYCVDMKGDRINHAYIAKVAKDFSNRGITSVDKVEKELSAYVLRTGELNKIFKALSIKRTPDIEDSELYKKWTEHMHFDAENVVFAATKLKKGSMAKLDSFMNELYSMKSFSMQEIENYAEQKQQVYDLAVRINKALSVYEDVIETVVNTYTNKWLSYGFSGETLLFIASRCFKQGNNTLPKMDELIERLHERGFIDLSSVGDYFDSQKKTEEFITKMLTVAGLNRRPNPWDKENLTTWKSWNFSEEMILEAAKLSAGKSSPIAYMNAVLSNWKNKNVFAVTEIDDSVKPTENTQESYNREYSRRRALALSRAQKNTEKATTVSGFSEIYAKINSMEKDLAFAEISGDNALLLKLETEQKSLISQADNMLKAVNLTLKDLSPVYACSKCNDTGYVGTHRCDCLNKKVD
ncbi:MAG: DnaD domain protein [Clostridia bacterium]|nr:DnaD domain protein [Clostridia bacterium]